MSGPLLFISHSRVKPGRLDAYQELAAEAVELVESEEPRMIGFNNYASDDRTEVSTVQLHPDAESLDSHLKIFSERLEEGAFANLDPYEVDVYGAASAAALAMLKEMQSQLPGLQVRVHPEHEGGFLRPQPL